MDDFFIPFMMRLVFAKFLTISGVHSFPRMYLRIKSSEPHIITTAKLYLPLCIHTIIKKYRMIYLVLCLFADMKHSAGEWFAEINEHLKRWILESHKCSLTSIKWKFLYVKNTVTIGYQINKIMKPTVPISWPVFKRISYRK